MALATTPTQAGFLDFIRNAMGINSTVLPDNSDWIPFAYEVAVATANVLGATSSLPQLYVLAVYNLGGDVLINYAQDLPDAAVYKNKLPFFQYMRKQFNINGFVSGVIQSASDESTSESMVVPDSLSQLSLSDLQNLKTPWGRNYLAWAQKYGPAVWGLTT